MKRVMVTIKQLKPETVYISITILNTYIHVCVFFSCINNLMVCVTYLISECYKIRKKVLLAFIGLIVAAFFGNSSIMWMGESYSECDLPFLFHKIFL